jgi:hypothetical protein
MKMPWRANMKQVTATIADVKRELAALEAAIAKDPTLEGLVGKKLATAVDALTPKDGVTKDLQQAYTNGEKWWSVRFADDEAEGCTKENKLVKIREYILKTDAYGRHYGTAVTREKVEQWLTEKFPAPPNPQQAEAA